MIQDLDDVVEVIQEYIIMELWGAGRSASRSRTSLTLEPQCSQ
jgi:hypothetical protein